MALSLSCVVLTGATSDGRPRPLSKETQKVSLCPVFSCTNWTSTLRKDRGTTVLPVLPPRSLPPLPPARVPALALSPSTTCKSNNSVGCALLPPLPCRPSPGGARVTTRSKLSSRDTILKAASLVSPNTMLSRAARCWASVNSTQPCSSEVHKKGHTVSKHRTMLHTHRFMSKGWVATPPRQHLVLVGCSTGLQSLARRAAGRLRCASTRQSRRSQ